MKRFVFCLLFALLAFSVSFPALAQEQTPSGPFGDNGYIDPSLTADVVNLPLCSPPSACTDTGQPDGTPVTGDFIRIVGEDGSVYVFPDPATQVEINGMALAARPVAFQVIVGPETAPNTPQLTTTYVDFGPPGSQNYAALQSALCDQGYCNLNAPDPATLLQWIKDGSLLGDPAIILAGNPVALVYHLPLYSYTPATCQTIPGLCPAVPAPPPASACSAPVTSQGRITMTASKTAPNFPLVVGQDPEKRGADAVWEVRVEPTIYTYWTQEPIYETVCSEWHAGDPARNCKLPGSWYNNGFTHTAITRYTCEQHTQVYPESLHRITASANLSQSSRDWILTGDLQIRYPSAYLHNPSFSWVGNPGAGAFQGDTFVWSFSRGHIQFADPGYFDLGASGSTSGTPVSDPRGFSLSGSQVDVYLKEVVIIR